MDYGKGLAYTVSQVNELVKDLLDGDSRLSGILIRGEASNYRIYPSGHHYFTLKDSTGVLKCVMFKREASQLRFTPQDGMKLIAAGRITVYPRDGQYQLYCSTIQPDGVGSLALAFEQLKAKLAAEGLFALERKRALPRFPKRVALVTSPAGAAVRDMIRIMGRRWPLCEVIVVPVRVQGVEAPDEIVSGIEFVNEGRLADVIITGRGGGSLEDLWAFNEERVARAIFSSEIPVVSAVGHEPDVTIADFVADIRAATPSHAAELVTPDMTQWKEQLIGVTKRLRSPQSIIEDRRLRLDSLTQRIISSGKGYIDRRRGRLDALSAKLAALDPAAVLLRGYAIVRTDKLISDSKQITVGDTVRISLAKGEFTAKVTTIEN